MFLRIAGARSAEQSGIIRSGKRPFDASIIKYDAHEQTDRGRKERKMSGKLYGVGVGPGDPRLMTCLAVETIEHCPVIAVPSEVREHALSYRIASGMVKGIENKECLNLSTPMTRNRQVLEQSYQRAAERITACLDAGKDVAYLTLGDPTIYSTYIYIHRLVAGRGYAAQMINGVPSFCAVAARLGDSLADRSEQLHILPSAYAVDEALAYPGNKVLMKAAPRLNEVKEHLREMGMQGIMVENCGLSDERIYQGVEEMPEKASYYATVVVKDRQRDSGGKDRQNNSGEKNRQRDGKEEGRDEWVKKYVQG